MSTDVNEIFSFLEKEDYASALESCDRITGEFMASFMDALTVNTATDYVGSVILYARICAAVKKPWKAFPKLEAARGALRFMKDFMADGEMLAETYRSFAEAYAYGGYLPEAVSCFADSARFFENRSAALDAYSSALFYQARFGKELIEDESVFAEKFGDDALADAKKNADSEASAQILTDPVESTDVFLKNRFEIEKLTDELLRASVNPDVPFCALYWNTKKNVLKKKFGIEWKTPAEMNPNVRFY